MSNRDLGHDAKRPLRDLRHAASNDRSPSKMVPGELEEAQVFDDVASSRKVIER
jgi:hypothetical protein